MLPHEFISGLHTINFPKILYSGFVQFILPIHTKHLNWLLSYYDFRLISSFHLHVCLQTSKMLFYFCTSLLVFVFFVDICFIFVFLLLSHQLLWSWKLPVDFISQLWSRFPRNHRHNIFFTPESSIYIAFLKKKMEFPETEQQTERDFVVLDTFDSFLELKTGF